MLAINEHFGVSQELLGSASGQFQVCQSASSLLWSAVYAELPAFKGVHAWQRSSGIHYRGSARGHAGLTVHAWHGRPQIAREKQDFERVVVSREEALAMFPENKFKAEIIQGLAPDATISLYRCGPMVRAPLFPGTRPAALAA